MQTRRLKHNSHLFPNPGLPIIPNFLDNFKTEKKYKEFFFLNVEKKFVNIFFYLFPHPGLPVQRQAPDIVQPIGAVIAGDDPELVVVHSRAVGRARHGGPARPFVPKKKKYMIYVS